MIGISSLRNTNASVYINGEPLFMPGAYSKRSKNRCGFTLKFGQGFQKNKRRQTS